MLWILPLSLLGNTDREAFIFFFSFCSIFLLLLHHHHHLLLFFIFWKWIKRVKLCVRYTVSNFNCTARQCSPLRRKFMECSINSPALSLLMKHLVIGQRLKTPNFSAFRWSPGGSLVSICQHFVATRVVHLPKSTETTLITESDQSGPNHQL